MTEKTNRRGGAEPLFRGKWPPVVQRLIIQAAAAGRSQQHHRAAYDTALGKLQRLAERCEGVTCPTVKEAGLALAKAPRGGIQAPFMSFSDALLARSREPLEPAEERAVVLLSNQAMWQMQELERQVKAELEAQRQAMTLKAQASQLIEVAKKGTGGVH